MRQCLVSNKLVLTKWMALPCVLLLATMLAAQTDSTQTSSTPSSSAQTAPAQTVSTQTGPAVPAGTALMVRLETTLATFSNRPGDPFRGSLTQAVVVKGQTLIPAGATVEGRVVKVSEPRRISGKPSITILPEAVILPNGERHYLDATLTDTSIPGTDVNSEGQFKGSGHDRRDQLEVGGGAAGGMLVGGLIGGGPGVLIGGAVGATSTTVLWLTKHRSAMMPAGTELTLELNRPMSLTGNASPATGGGSK